VLTQRSVVYGLAALAILSLAWLLIPQVAPEGIIRTVVTIVFWLSFILLVVALFQMRHQPGARDVETEGPGFARFLFNNSAAGLFWLPIRIFLGLAWLQSGVNKLNDPGWTEGRHSRGPGPTGDHV
jgi:hypothetical protein